MKPQWCTRCGRYFDDPVFDDPVPDVVRTACTLWNVPVKQLLSPSRKATIVAARQPVAAVLYHRYGMTLADIGAELDRDHTTILHAIRRADPDRVIELTAALTEAESV
jgi:chromosomal replication initiation ATPase DnaA